MSQALSSVSIPD